MFSLKPPGHKVWTVNIS